MLNKISVENINSRYIKDPHPTILIDGLALDCFLNNFYPGDYILGLIPTIVDWISLDEESKLVEQIFDRTDTKKILPILMCPDDCDLSCTVIVAEVETTSDYVIWNRIGVDKNNPKDLLEKNRFLESGVEWIEKVPFFIFNKEDYQSLNKIYKQRT